MRGLAEYAMSGRLQAATVAILFGLIPGLSIVSGAVVALVTLRRGWQDGWQILLWALLPAGLQWLMGDPSYAFVLLGTWGAAILLRFRQTWQPVVLLMLVGGIALQSSLPWQTSYLARVQQAVETLQKNGVELQVMVDGQAAKATAEQLKQALLMYYGAYQMLMMFGCMALARYWQALLYNPGGFRQEFHQLRFDWRLMALLLVLIVLAFAGTVPLKDWLFMLCMVPVLQGVALVHFMVTRGNLGRGWLVLAYLLLLIAAPAYALLGFVDCVVDIRKRLPVKTDHE